MRRLIRMHRFRNRRLYSTRAALFVTIPILTSHQPAHTMSACKTNWASDNSIHRRYQASLSDNVSCMMGDTTRSSSFCRSIHREPPRAEVQELIQFLRNDPDPL